MPYHKKMGYNMTNIDYASPIPTPIIAFGKSRIKLVLRLPTGHQNKTARVAPYDGIYKSKFKCKLCSVHLLNLYTI